jgi:hypothetical protein
MAPEDPSIEERLEDLRTLADAGFELMPLRPLKKLPYKGWRHANYTNFDAEAYLKAGGNVGIRLRPTELVVDVDYKNGGALSFEMLCWDEGIDPTTLATVISGSAEGGRHYFFKKPPLTLVPKVKKLPGIDFLSHKKYVVAAGSVHPDSKFTYRISGSRADFVRAVDTSAPAALLRLLNRRARKSSDNSSPGKLTNDQIAELLSHLDASDFGSRSGGKHADEWLGIAMAVHHASNGNATDEFLAWCATDETYSSEEDIEKTRARWESFRCSIESGITELTLYRAVSRSGKQGKALVASIGRPSAAEEFQDQPVQATSETHAGLTVRRASDITPKPISWLWHGRIAHGKLTGIAGPPDQGKSQLTAFIASIVSTGGEWPYGGRAEAGDVIILSAEDDASDTIVPRLMAAGADLEKVHLVDMMVKPDQSKSQRMLSLKEDIGRLTELLRLYPSVRLVVIDPISAYMGAGSVDTHKNADVRGVLAPLGNLAENAGVAILFISHFSKNSGGSALNKVTDSHAFTAVARGFWAVVTEKIDGKATGRKFMLKLKNNISSEVPGLAYRIEGVSLPNGIETSRIVWDGQVDITAEEAVAGSSPQKQPLEVDKAMAFIENALADGPVKSADLRAEAEEAGITAATMRRAGKKLGVHPYMSGGCWWSELESTEARAA